MIARRIERLGARARCPLCRGRFGADAGGQAGGERDESEESRHRWVPPLSLGVLAHDVRAGGALPWAGCQPAVGRRASTPLSGTSPRRLRASRRSIHTSSAHVLAFRPRRKSVDEIYLVEYYAETFRPATTAAGAISCGMTADFCANQTWTGVEAEGARAECG